MLSPSQTGPSGSNEAFGGGTPTSPSESGSGTPSPTESSSPTPSPSPIPTQAPVTGGGGTAGFQDAGLAVLGGAAIVAGLLSIAYRRRMTRRR
jgi:hypothetical protein